MITKIRKFKNNNVIIIPKRLLRDIGFPKSVNIDIVDNGILIRPANNINNKIINKKIIYKSQNKDETLFKLMKAKLDDNIKSGKVRWLNDREMERIIF